MRARDTPSLSRGRAALLVVLCAIAVAGVWLRRNDVAIAALAAVLVAAAVAERLQHRPGRSTPADSSH